MNELDIAKQIANGELESPQKYSENLWLYALRITGTGVSFRDKLDEYVYRNPDDYLNDDFIARCAGLPVIWFHPDNKTELLDSNEYAKRAVGSIMFAYPIGNEVWGIARIYDETAAQEMNNNQLSTSPGVIVSQSFLTNFNINNSVNKILIEGKPALLDHLAICMQGVWDKGSEPLGVSTQQTVRTDSMDITPEKEGQAQVAEPSLSDIMNALIQLSGRIEALETAEKTESEGHEKAAQSLGQPEKAVADNDEDMRRQKMQMDDCNDDAKADNAEAIKTFDDDDDSKKSKKKEKMESKIVADAIERQNKELKAQIAALEAKIPVILSDIEMNELFSAQAKADSVAAAFGEKAPAPLVHLGEKPLAYRKRLLSLFKKHSETWKNVDPANFADSTMLEIAEKAVYADAMAASNIPESYAPGVLHEKVTRMRGGGEIVTFTGDPNSWMNQFKMPSSKVLGFNTKGN